MLSCPSVLADLQSLSFIIMVNQASNSSLKLEIKHHVAAASVKDEDFVQRTIAGPLP